MEKQKNPELILGFVGKVAAGKGSAISYLVEEYGFFSSSCSDRIREEILKQGKEINRETLQEVGGILRKQHGPAVLAEKTWQNLLENKVEKAVIDSIRGIEEVEYLKRIKNFYLIFVDADMKTRFQRTVERGRGDPVTWGEFIKSEERDLTGDGRNITACIEAADFKIENDGTLGQLYVQLEEILRGIKGHQKNG